MIDRVSLLRKYLLDTFKEVLGYFSSASWAVPGRATRMRVFSSPLGHSAIRFQKLPGPNAIYISGK